MQDNEVAVPGAPNVNLDQIHADAQGCIDGGECITGRGVTSGAAVTDAKRMTGTRHSHEAIMTDLADSDSGLPGTARACATDLDKLARLERWYEEHCQPVSEVCIVPLPGGPSEHLHAVVVPDFQLLKERRQPNSRELIRFEFQEASKQLALAERPHTFSVRAQALPRTANGEPDREGLRIELSDAIAPVGAAPAAEEDRLREIVCQLIREQRPAACTQQGANLEIDLGFDSLDRILLICSVENSFGIAIPPEQAARIFTVGDLIDAVASSNGQRAPLAPATLPASSSWAEILNRPLNPHERNLADSILKARPALSFMAWGAAQMIRVIAAPRFRFQVRGRERLPDNGAYLLVANHCSHLDPLFLLWALPFSIARRLSFMGHTEYFGAGWKAAVATRLKLVPVDPDEHALEGIRLCAEALRRGLIGAVFPEGERSPDGAQQRFHRGIALLALQLQLPIVPVAIGGTYEVLPRRRQHIRSAPVQVTFGPPLRAEHGETEQSLLARVWAAVWRMRGADARSREPIPRPFDIESGAGL